MTVRHVGETVEADNFSRNVAGVYTDVRDFRYLINRPEFAGADIVAGEVGVVDTRYPLWSADRYGVTEDSGVTDNRPLLQNALVSAAATGVGRMVVTRKGTGYYGHLGALSHVNGVRLIGIGKPLLWNKLTGAFTSTLISALGSNFRIGGVEGGTPQWIDGNTFYACGAEYAGQDSISFNTAGDSANFTAGQIVYIRTVAQDLYYTQKALPLYTELNEILSVSAGVLELKYPLKNDYDALLVSPSGTRVDVVNAGHFYNEVAVRFSIEGFRLRTADASIHATFVYGGAWECEFKDLDIDNAGEFVQINAMGRCKFSNVRMRTYIGGGEFGYYSHDCEFDNIDAMHYIDPLSVVGGGTDATRNPRNGWNFTENATDMKMRRLRLNFSGSGRAFVMGNGQGNELRGFKIIAARSESLGAIDLTAEGLQYKTRGCVVADGTLHVADLNDAGSFRIARFGVAIDSGGQYGGGNVVSNVKVIGNAMIAPVGLMRLDKKNAHASNAPCDGNTVENISWLKSDVGGVLTDITLPAVVEWNNLAPSGGLETVIDPGFRWGDNIVRNINSRNRQPESQRMNPGSSSAAAYTTLADYTIRRSPGTHSVFRIEASGRATGTANTKSVFLFMGGTQVFEIPYLAAGNGTWRFVAEIAGYRTPPNSGTYTHADLLPQKQLVRVVAYSNGVLVNDTTYTRTHSIITTDLLVELVAYVTNPADAIIAESWRVMPQYGEASLVDWAALNARWGSYPTL